MAYDMFILIYDDSFVHGFEEWNKRDILKTVAAVSSVQI